MRAGLRTVLAACLGGVGLAFTIGTAALLQAEAGGRIRQMIGVQLHGYAGQVADKLDRGMFERYRDLLVVTSLEAIRSAEATRESRRAVLQKLQDTYPDYAWIGFIEPRGILQAATGRVNEGRDVNGRDWWRQALERPYVGDVHDAVVLAKLLYADRPEVPRFVDLAAPVRDEGGAVLGVVAAHLSWDWATEVERSVLGEIVEGRRLEAMILAADDTVLLGPKPLVGQRLADLPSPSAEAGLRVWPDGTAYMTGLAVTKGYRDYPGLGWKVVLREPAALAMAPVTALRDRVIAWGVAGSLLAVVVGYLLATWIAAPLRAMAGAVGAAPEGALPTLPAASRYAEVATLSAAIRSYVGKLWRAERSLKESLEEKTTLLHEVHHRVKNNLQVVYGLMMMEMRRLPKGDPGRDRLEALSRRITAMGRLHEQLCLSDDLARLDFADHLRRLCDALSGLRPHEAVAIRVEAEPTICSLEAATPLGLIANELVSNALKHGFPAGRPGCVSVTLAHDAAGLRLVVADDGAGCAGGPPSGGVGTALVNALVVQIGGRLTFDTRDGCRATLTVPAAARNGVREAPQPAVAV
ncbi:two-component sensor histidine kinase [Azospirillum agricola]|uniref:sensor histidine kinase n=1 Tax=Azospirillum agricola TaxID=1720247 RepID=UPI002D7F8138|nr:sensor histidine kinase [Azospirillum agricola]MBP2232249.1 two-component sensor histidine kinase [Azospirillum agricola]